MEFKIYTRGGDGGETSLFGGRREPKDHVRVEAYGTVDELNASLGVLVAQVADLDASIVPEPCAVSFLRGIQEDLFVLGSELATPPGQASAIEPLRARDVDKLEAAIDAVTEGLPPLTHFILPGGSPAAAATHVCRASARRAERRVVTLARASAVEGEAVRYLNRLSDYLFVAARAYTQASNQDEFTWAPRG